MSAETDDTVFVLRNYNTFLVVGAGTTDAHRWVDFYVHRFRNDFNKLVKFGTRQEAQAFIDQHPEIEADFDAWIWSTKRSEWL